MTSPTAARRRAPRMHHRRMSRYGLWLMLVPAAAFVVVVYLVPLVQNIRMSLLDFTTATFFTGEAPFVGFANYVTALQDPDFGTAVVNTFLFTGVSVVAQFVVGMSLALFFNRRFPGRATFRAILLLPWLLPLVVTGTIWKWLLAGDSGALNRILSAIGLDGSTPFLAESTTAVIAVMVINVWIGVPFNLAICFAALQDVPPELLEAASLDGAGAFRRFRSITLPTIRPVIAVLVILGIVYTLKILDVLLVLTSGGPAQSTVTLALLSFQQSFQKFQFGVGSATSTILVLITTVFAAIYLWSIREEAKR